MGTPPDMPIPDYLAREVLKLTVHSAVELEAVWAQVSKNCRRDRNAVARGLSSLLLRTGVNPLKGESHSKQLMSRN